VPSRTRVIVFKAFSISVYGSRSLNPVLNIDFPEIKLKMAKKNYLFKCFSRLCIYCDKQQHSKESNRGFELLHSKKEANNDSATHFDCSRAREPAVHTNIWYCHCRKSVRPRKSAPL